MFPPRYFRGHKDNHNILKTNNFATILLTMSSTSGKVSGHPDNIFRTSGDFIGIFMIYLWAMEKFSGQF